MTIRKRYDRAVGEFIDAVHEWGEESVTADEVLDLFLDFRNTVALSRLRKLQASTPFSRPCYDKPHRCPGWAGGGMQWAMVYRCEKGSLHAPYYRRYWLGTRCPECRLFVLPIAVEWLDWRWWRHRVTHPRWPWWLSPLEIRVRIAVWREYR